MFMQCTGKFLNSKDKKSHLTHMDSMFTFTLVRNIVVKSVCLTLLATKPGQWKVQDPGSCSIQGRLEHNIALFPNRHWSDKAVQANSAETIKWWEDRKQLCSRSNNSKWGSQMVHGKYLNDWGVNKIYSSINFHCTQHDSFYGIIIEEIRPFAIP